MNKSSLLNAVIASVTVAITVERGLNGGNPWVVALLAAVATFMAFRTVRLISLDR